MVVVNELRILNLCPTDIRGRPPLPTPQELKSANRALKKVQRTTPPPKRHSSMVLKSRTVSCHSPRLPSSCEFKFPPDHCPESFQPRSPVSHSKLRLSPLPPTPSPVQPPVSPRAHKPIPPIKPQKPGKPYVCLALHRFIRVSFVGLLQEGPN